MPGFFSKIAKCAPPFSSSAAHRHAERTLAGTALISATLQQINIASIIPAKFSQFLISGYSVVREDTHTCEKLLHSLQGLLALTQTALAITMFLTSEDCENESQTLCQWMFVLDLLYTAVLTAGWLPSEISKDEKPSSVRSSSEVTGILPYETDSASSSLSDVIIQG